MKSSVYIIAIAIIIPLLGTSQTDLFLVKSLKEEIIYDKTPVSGEIRVGIVSEMKDTSISTEFLFTTLPDIDLEGKMLCALVSSKDGLYKGTLPYKLDNEMKGTVRLEWDSKYATDIAKYSQKDITVLCKIAESCSSTAEYYTIASWTDHSEENFYILLNATHKPRILLDNASKKYCACEKIDSDKNVTYNYKCQIPYEVISDSTTFKINQKVSRLGRTTTQAYPLPLSAIQQ